MAASNDWYPLERSSVGTRSSTDPPVTGRRPQASTLAFWALVFLPHVVCLPALIYCSIFQRSLRSSVSLHRHRSSDTPFPQLFLSRPLRYVSNLNLITTHSLSSIHLSPALPYHVQVHWLPSISGTLVSAGLLPSDLCTFCTSSSHSPTCTIRCIRFLSCSHS